MICLTICTNLCIYCNQSLISLESTPLRISFNHRVDNQGTQFHSVTLYYMYGRRGRSLYLMLRCGQSLPFIVLAYGIVTMALPKRRGVFVANKISITWKISYENNTSPLLRQHQAPLCNIVQTSFRVIQIFKICTKYHSGTVCVICSDTSW